MSTAAYSSTPRFEDHLTLKMQGLCLGIAQSGALKTRKNSGVIIILYNQQDSF